MLIVRPAKPSEIDAAIEVCRVANVSQNLPHHPELLKSWAVDPTAVLFIADEGAGPVGMTLSLVGRADDGAGEVVRGLRHLTGVWFTRHDNGRASVANCWTPHSIMPARMLANG